jgi:hypothetical protein
MANLVGALLAVRLTLGPVWTPMTPSSVVVDLPAGSVAPGRAELTIREPNSESVTHRVSFDMPKTGGTRQRIWLDPQGQGAVTRKLDVAVSSQSGPGFQKTLGIEGTVPIANDILFVGSSGELEEFDRALRQVTEASQATHLLSTIRVVGREAVEPSECRTLVGSAMVVVRSIEWEPTGRKLFECAARGAHVLYVGSPPPPPLAKLEPGRAWFFGNGNAAHAAELDVVAAKAALDVSGGSSARPSTRETMNLLELARRPVSGKRPIPGRGAILAVLAAYVVLIGPIGWFVGRRGRKTLVLWAWFPCVALATVVVFTLVGQRSYRESRQLTLSHFSLEAPGLGGLVRGELGLGGLDAENGSVSLPWREADLMDVGRTYRFGSPFRRAAPHIELVEDAIGGRLEARGLVVERYGLASLGYVAPVTARPGARVERLSAGAIRVTNTSSSPLVRTLLAVEAGAWIDVGRLAPGETRVVTPVRNHPSAPLPTNESDFREEYQVAQVRDAVPAGHFFLAFELEASRPEGIRTVPSVPMKYRDVRFVLGPLGEAGS